MNTVIKKLFAAPWSNQTVSPFLRGVAWLLTVLFGFGLATAVYFTVKEGFSGMTTEFKVSFAGCFYLWLLFIYVARKGKAPSGWLPW